MLRSVANSCWWLCAACARLPHDGNRWGLFVTLCDATADCLVVGRYVTRQSLSLSLYVCNLHSALSRCFNTCHALILRTYARCGGGGDFLVSWERFFGISRPRAAVSRFRHDSCRRISITRSTILLSIVVIHLQRVQWLGGGDLLL